MSERASVAAEDEVLVPRRRAVRRRGSTGVDVAKHAGAGAHPCARKMWFARLASKQAIDALFAVRTRTGGPAMPIACDAAQRLLRLIEAAAIEVDAALAAEQRGARRRRT